MLDDFDDEVLDEDFVDEEEEAPPEETGNRTFLIAIGILGFLIVVSLICLSAYIFLIAPRTGANRAERETQAAIALAQQTQVALAAQQTEDAAATMTARPTETQIPTDTPTPTSVVAQPTETAEPTQDPRTATVEALLTQAAGATPADTPTSFPTELPDTGFADDVGIPGLLGLALLAVVVIFLVRRLRTATS